MIAFTFIFHKFYNPLSYNQYYLVSLSKTSESLKGLKRFTFSIISNEFTRTWQKEYSRKWLKKIKYFTFWEITVTKI